MTEFFKQLLAQFTAIWQRLSLQQRIIITALVALTVLGLAGLMLFAQKSVSSSNGYRVLYSDLALEEASAITEKLIEAKQPYKLESEGHTILVREKSLYEVRMTLARAGLPKSHGIGYELFDKTNLGMTDFVQKVNSRRALEGELQRTIEGLEEVKSARVHLVLPEESVFLDKQRDAKASVVLRMVSGRTVSKDQIRGIAYLVSSSVEGLKPDLISVIDFEGRLLSSPYGEDQTALSASRNMELQQNVEKYLEMKASGILEEVLGPGKSTVKISVDLDFDKVEKTMENFDPESRVIRSEERTDEHTKNAPTGDHQTEKSLTNYEINKTVQNIIQETGNVKRLTVSVAVDGKYDVAKGGKKTYVPRPQEYLQNLEQMVKNTVGYDIARGDQITIANVQFDNEYLRDERESMKQQDQMDMWFRIAKYVLAVLLVLMLVFFLRYVARTLADAMNPPVPQMKALGMPEPLPEMIPEDVRRSSELLERVEMLSREEPVNIASIIRQWLNEPVAQVRKKK